MNLASAYPNSDISVGAMTAIAVAVLACWLVMVYVADDLAENEHEETVLRV